MVDESDEPESRGGQADEVQPASETQSGMLGRRSSGEGLVALAGLVLVAVWLIFDVLVDNYGIDNTVPVLGAAAALVFRLDRNTVGSVPIPLIMKALGYTIAIFGLIEIILDLRFSVYDDFGIVIAALLGYAGFILAFIGARSIKLDS